MTATRAYYNDNDPKVAAWLRELIADGLLPAGDVDERSIGDVRPRDLIGYTQCHFFAGIGGWPYALRLAGWPDDRPVWTGSCPCQPLSGAGKRQGHADERHLWPAFFGLIAECGPAAVVGEQVASKDGREWLAAVRADLERTGYACGAADLPAAGVGAPHIRQRLFWVAERLADACRERRDGEPVRLQPGQPREAGAEAAGSGGDGGLDDAAGARHIGALGHAEGNSRDEARVRLSGAGREAGGLAIAHGAEQQAHPHHGFWDAADWLWCRDGKWRPVEPGTFPLAHGLPARVGRLRGYGNAIVPQVAAAFVAAWLDTQKNAAPALHKR
jgi:DNA (cytosine-5)-methyltransferase 1